MKETGAIVEIMRLSKNRVTTKKKGSFTGNEEKLFTALDRDRKTKGGEKGDISSSEGIREDKVIKNKLFWKNGGRSSGKLYERKGKVTPFGPRNEENKKGEVGNPSPMRIKTEEKTRIVRSPSHREEESGTTAKTERKITSSCTPSEEKWRNRSLMGRASNDRMKGAYLCVVM